MSYKVVDPQIISKIKYRVSLLFITATDIERRALHKELRPIPGEADIIVVHQGNQTYFLGIFGGYIICHVQTSMGSSGQHSSSMTVTESIQVWEPKAIIMVGIAYGVNSTKQKIGDVLISESVSQYESKKISLAGVEMRGSIPLAGNILLNRFKNVFDWHYETDNGAANLIIGRILSGDTLINDKDHRDSLLAYHPTAVGGEMEGVGLTIAAGANKVEWLIVKGICDFADGNKDENKENNQITAADSAVSLCLKVFSEKYGFSELGFKFIDNNESSHSSIENTIIDFSSLQKILFIVYHLEYEKYYHERQQDHSMQMQLNLSSIWIYGESGVGKTNLALRNVAISGNEIILIDFSYCVDQNITGIFDYINYVLLSKISKLNFHNLSSGFQEASRSLSNTLHMFYAKRGLCLLFEELPVEHEGEYEEFLKYMLSFLIAYNNENPKSYVKFLFTSIQDPRPYIGSKHKKIVERVKFMHIDKWSNEDIKLLIISLSKEIGLKYSEEEILSITHASQGLPRFVKNFLSNYISQIKNNENSIAEAISVTANELGLS